MLKDAELIAEEIGQYSQQTPEEFGIDGFAILEYLNTIDVTQLPYEEKESPWRELGSQIGNSMIYVALLWDGGGSNIASVKLKGENEIWSIERKIEASTNSISDDRSIIRNLSDGRTVRATYRWYWGKTKPELESGLSVDILENGSQVRTHKSVNVVIYDTRGAASTQGIILEDGSGNYLVEEPVPGDRSTLRFANEAERNLHAWFRVVLGVRDESLLPQ